ncbi:hypothetical protein EO087_10220 [Dyella sp. M7H15-1]|uniref:hypothetical protein n=1 Tax=Dyella sp. M7H15-1 TaxID=2501295 RepID=UPI001005157F|nr:hypothetical protein [Dyella sp. M7H15-1]QAU24317.1 hypothetical protein EO087_10220 [Dyella sp. M7H15-1]
MKKLNRISLALACAAYCSVGAVYAADTRPDVDMTIFNNTSQTMYPVVRNASSGQEKRIYVHGANGVAANSQATVTIPGDMGDAGQILVFSQAPTNLPQEPSAADLEAHGSKTPHGNVVLITPTPDAFREDHPNQLMEYTIDGGKDAGYIDYDYSGVNHLSLPVTLQATDDNDVAVMGYSGTTSSVADMQAKLQKLVNGTLTGHYFSNDKTVGWDFYQQDVGALIKIPTAYNSFVLADSSSYLVNPPKNGTMLVTSIDGQPIVGTPWVSDVLTERWLAWLNVNNGAGHFNVPAADGVEQVVVPGQFATGCQGDTFCNDFAKSVQKVFAAAASNLQQRGVISGVDNFASAKVVIENLLGYNFSSDPTLPNYLPDDIRDTYKSIMRGVPTPADEKNTELLHPDPAGPNAKYNLNVIDWFVHKVMGFYGYGFSIDDDRANIRSPGTRLIMTIGGSKGLSYDEMFNPDQQQVVIFGAGWTNISSGSQGEPGALSGCKLDGNGAASCPVGIDGKHTDGVFNHVVASLGDASLSVDVVPSSTGLDFKNCAISHNDDNKIGPDICSVIKPDANNPFILVIPNPGAGGGGGGGGTQENLAFANGWQAFSSVDKVCALNDKVNGSNAPSNNIGGTPGSIGFTQPNGSTCTFRGIDVNNNRFTYTLTSSTATCTVDATKSPCRTPPAAYQGLIVPDAASELP